MPERIDALGYWRMSSSPQEKSIPQQRAEMLPRCKLEGVELVAECKDEAKSGGGMKKRDDFQAMLRYCQERQKQGKPIAAIVCYDASRFSRADSNETSAYIWWQFRQAGVNRLLTWERWFDFRKEEDRAIFNIQQDFTNNRYLRDLSARVLRGKKNVAAAGYFTGGQVPYAFERVLLDDQGNEVQRFRRGEQVRFRKLGWREVLAPIAEDDPDPSRQLERQTAVWLFETFDANTVSYCWLAEQLNLRDVPGPGTGYRRRRPKPDQTKWTVRAVIGILTNPVYAGVSRTGAAGRGTYHRLVNGEIQATDPGAPRVQNTEGLIFAKLDHGGLVDPALFQRVQAKVEERSRKCSLSRSRGYILPGGILYCGHCGGRMYGCTMKPKRGGRQYEYRKYVCGTPSVKPGTCRHYSIDEDRVVKVLLAKLLRDYLAPARLEGLRQALRKRTQKRHERAPAEADRLQARLTELEDGIKTARRHALQTKDDATFAELNEGLKELLAERKQLQQKLATAEKCQAESVEDATARVEAAIDQLEELRKKLKVLGSLSFTDPDVRRKLGEVLRRLVSRVDLHFEASAAGKKVWYRFVKGAVKVRPLLPVQGSETSDR
jgi:DNA invertase Pin-like site-specific DNA recombinase